jgi:hypothetical protein
VSLRCHLCYKGDLDQNPSHFLHCHFFSFSSRSPPPTCFLNQRSAAPLQSLGANHSPPAMAASHPHLFQQFVADESEILKLIANCFLPDRVVLQWRPAPREDIPTPNTNEIVVFSSFRRGFGLPAYDFLRGLLQHYQIELVHLNSNSIL